MSWKGQRAPGPPCQMAALSVAVLALYALVIVVGAVRLFAKASTK